MKRKLFAAALAVANLAFAQQTSIVPVQPSVPILVRPYTPVAVPPIRLANSNRLRDLIRGGILYLTAQDAIALALENNIDIEIARYNPIIDAWNVERAQAGGALPGVPSGASQAGSVATGQGVAGSQAAAGVSISGTGTNGGGTVNATVTQVGPVTQVLDPIVQEASTFTHKSTPYPNTLLSGVPDLISGTRVHSFTIQDGFLTGGNVSVNYTDHFLNENAPSDLLNPEVSQSVTISVAHNLLRGLGIAVNARTITVAKMNLAESNVVFKQQVINTVADVLNLYYGLSADYDDLRAKRAALDVAQTFFNDTKEQERIGSLSSLDVTTAESQVATAQQDVVVSETTLRQQEVQLKNLISRTGLADPLVRETRIIPVEHIVVPEKDDLPPVPELVRQAVANRTDISLQKASVQTSEVSALGTKNGLLPVLQAFAGQTNAGLAGAPHNVFFTAPNGQVFEESPDPYFAGGTGNALGQIFRNNFPTEHIGAYYLANVHNWQAQADYGIDQLSLRQSQLLTQKAISQAQVDVVNAVVALRQARARYDAAVHNRILDAQLLDAEQRKYKLGASTPYNVTQQQRDLSIAQASETAALASYSNARILLAQMLGTTLDDYGISISEARTGHVMRVSTPPAPPTQQP